MRGILIFTFLTGLSSAILAQHAGLSTREWEILASRNELRPVNGKIIFPSKLMELNNQVIDLPGYVIPVKTGSKFDTFMLSMVPMFSCPYCGSGNIPPMVEVHLLKSEVSADSDIISVRGKLTINNSGNGKSEFVINNGRIVE